MVKLNLSRHEKEALTYLFETIDEDQDSLITLAEISKTFKDKFNLQISDDIYDKIEK
jgi:Ca2+-binding EF-hand superfamily protein